MGGLIPQSLFPHLQSPWCSVTQGPFQTHLLTISGKIRAYGVVISDEPVVGPFDLSPPSMVGRSIPDKVRQMALSMSLHSLQGIPYSEVYKYTGISVRSIM